MNELIGGSLYGSPLALSMASSFSAMAVCTIALMFVKMGSNWHAEMAITTPTLRGFQQASARGQTIAAFIF